MRSEAVDLSTPLSTITQVPFTSSNLMSVGMRSSESRAGRGILPTMRSHGRLTRRAR
jgi:hypothetical protein